MKRRLFTILSAFSLLLFVAVCVLWVRSYFVSDELISRTEQLDRRDGQVWNVIDKRLTSSQGWWSDSNFNDAGAPNTYSSQQQEHARNSVDRSSFEWRSLADPIPMQFVATRFGGQTPVPYWLTGLALTVLPTLWLTRPLRHRWQRRRRKHHIRRTGLCPSCGYDLRATPDRCPECGTTSATSA